MGIIYSPSLRIFHRYPYRRIPMFNSLNKYLFNGSIQLTTFLVISNKEQWWTQNYLTWVINQNDVIFIITREKYHEELWSVVRSATCFCWHLLCSSVTNVHYDIGFTFLPPVSRFARMIRSLGFSRVRSLSKVMWQQCNVLWCQQLNML